MAAIPVATRMAASRTQAEAADFSSLAVLPRHPYRYTGGIERGFDREPQASGQPVHVGFIARSCGEVAQHALRVIFTAVETAVDKVLDPTAQWTEESCNDQRRGNDRDGRLLPG